MHRQIMKPPKGMVVDHINCNGLHNRRRNLRICTQLQNSQKTHRRRPGKSRYRGVFPRGDKWQAAIQHDSEQMYLGLFDTEIEAAKARDRKVLELAGEFAVLNFPKATRACPGGGSAE
ncbi:MAG: HNH endonuclease [Phycisphaerales bacterium]|nr:MAG: HNH endonuclease [Phycisphaerales bacterium]